MQSLDGRFRTAKDPVELAQFTMVRGEVIKQDEVIVEAQHRRSLEKFERYRAAVMPPLVLLFGIITMAMGMAPVGFFIVGCALYMMAPEYVNEHMRKALKRLFGGEG